MNAVESMFRRLGISDFYLPFKESGVDRIVALRSVSDEKLAELIPDETARKTLKDAITRSGEAPAAPAAAAQPRYNDEAPSDYRGKGKGATREAGERRRGKRREDGEEFDEVPAKDLYKEEISVPWDSVRLLLGNKAERLNRIHHLCGTTNSRIDKPTECQATFAFELRGTKEGVAKARAEIETVVGITGQRNREARFEYARNELDRNVCAVEYLAAANVKNKGTPMELPDSLLTEILDTFRFTPPPKTTEFWCHMPQNTDKEKFETLTPLVKKLKAVQAIIFTTRARVDAMSKRSKQTADSFGVKTPQFVHRDMDKKERMMALEAFKNGEPGPNGCKERLLVTTYDYAKYARKVLIPYVNFIVHFHFPENKELYLHQTMCTGRNNRPGVSLLFVGTDDINDHKEWSKTVSLTEMSRGEWDNAIVNLEYDNDATQLTDNVNADPPLDWREALEREKEAKAAAKAAKAAAKTAKAAGVRV